MSAISKILVTTTVAAAIGFAGYVGMQRTSVAVFDSIEKAFEQVVVANPTLVSPADATNWLAANAEAIKVAQESQRLRKIGAWFALPGVRNDMASLNAELNHMIEMRAEHMATVQKRLTDNAVSTDSEWIKLLPQNVQGQVSSATRTIAWLKEDAKTHAAFQRMSQDFSVKSAQLAASLNLAGDFKNQDKAPAEKLAPLPVSPDAKQPVLNESAVDAVHESSKLIAKQ